MTAPADTYSAISGGAIYGGMAAPVASTGLTFDSVTIASEGSGYPTAADAGKILILELHESGGKNLTTGRQYRAQVSGAMAYGTYTEASFSTVKSITPGIILLRPVDYYDKYPNGINRESMWLGFTNLGDSGVTLMTARRVDALMSWAATELSMFNQSKACIIGGSMGGWGSMTLGLRRPDKFAAIYSSRPRWHYDSTGTKIAVANWDSPGGLESVVPSSAPNLAAVEGGGSYDDLLNNSKYVADTSKKIPFVAWCVGRNDGFTQFADHIAAVNAMRAAKRAFVFIWNDGGHGDTGTLLNRIMASYPYGTFELGKGYPLFTEHSLDQDPTVDLVGAINADLSFRNVVETASGWSCEVTSLAGACTVKVEPISEVFKASVTPQQVTVPAANTWVPVSFSA